MLDTCLLVLAGDSPSPGYSCYVSNFAYMPMYVNFLISAIPLLFLLFLFGGWVGESWSFSLNCILHLKHLLSSFLLNLIIGILFDICVGYLAVLLLGVAS